MSKQNGMSVWDSHSLLFCSGLFRLFFPWPREGCAAGSRDNSIDHSLIRPAGPALVSRHCAAGQIMRIGEQKWARALSLVMLCLVHVFVIHSVELVELIPRRVNSVGFVFCFFLSSFSSSLCVCSPSSHRPFVAVQLFLVGVHPRVQARLACHLDADNGVDSVSDNDATSPLEYKSASLEPDGN